MLDAIVAVLYGLDRDAFAWILKDCDHPQARLADKAFCRRLDPKGFWRVDKDKDPELRHTVLTLAAFRDLEDTIAAHGGDRDRGIEAFCSQNDGDGWMLPETLRLSDLGLGHDERARHPQPVRERLGERFYPFQLEQTAEESWKECELHARNLLGEEGYRHLQAELRGEVEPALAVEAADKATPRYGAEGEQRRLFPGERDLFGERKADPPSQKGRRRGSGKR